MDPLANTFSMSAGNPPRALTGRETQLEQFTRTPASKAGNPNRLALTPGMTGRWQVLELIALERRDDLRAPGAVCAEAARDLMGDFIRSLSRSGDNSLMTIGSCSDHRRETTRSDDSVHYDNISVTETAAGEYRA